LTPSDVHNVSFKKPPIGKRGYDQEAVDDFLDRVESTLTDMSAEISSLRTQRGDTPSRVPLPGTDALDAGQRAVLAELDLIKVRLTRIEDALTPERSPITLGDGTQGGAL
jgi:DivIVA domain-containing protein